MKKVLFRGGVLTQSGYGVHARQIYRYLMEKEEAGDIELYTQLLHWGDTPWILTKQNDIVKKAMETSVEIDDKTAKKEFDVTFQIQLPNEWNENLGKFNIGITAGVETTICNQEWLMACLKMDMVIVPSSFSKQVFIDSAQSEDLKQELQKKIIVIPETFPDTFLDQTSKENFDVEFSKNNVLIVGQITGLDAKSDRKNIFMSIKILCDILKGKEDWGIIIKTNAARNTRIDEKITYDILQKLVKEIGKKEFPKIHLIHGNLTEEEMLRLYKDKRVKCFVTMTKGEGYGLPILEAAACGVPIIATNWSGHLDFLKDKFLKLQYVLDDVPESKLKGGIFVKGSQWAAPNVRDFIDNINIFVKQDDVNKKKKATAIKQAKELQKTILTDYSFKSINTEFFVKIFNRLFV